jgi:ATP sulfurylase
MLGDMKIQQNEPTLLYCDNQGVLKLAKNPIFHKHTKHVDIHCHFIRQLVEDGTVESAILSYRGQTADILTKSLGPKKIVKFKDKLGVFSRLTIKGGC